MREKELWEIGMKLMLISHNGVGATGFEPATTWSQTRSATGLRYTPLLSDCKAMRAVSD